MSVSASSQGNVLAFTIQIANSAQASKTLRGFGDEIKRLQRDLGSFSVGGMPSAFGRLPASGFGRQSSASSSRERDFRRAEDQQLKAMFQGRQRAERDRLREEEQAQKQLAADARRAQSHKERVELLRVREAAAEDRKLAAEMAAGRRKAERERIAEQKKSDRDRDRDQKKAAREAARNEERAAYDAERERQLGLQEWRNARAMRRGGGTGHGRGGLFADLSRAAIPDHYVRSAFRIEDAVGALTSEGVGRRIAVNTRIANRAVNRFGNWASGGLLATSSLGPFGMGGGMAAAGGLALGAGALAGAFFSHQALTKGAPKGGVMDKSGSWLVDQQIALNEMFGLGHNDMYPEHARGPGKWDIGYGDLLAGQGMNLYESKRRIARLQGTAATSNARNAAAISSGIARASVSRSMATFGDIRSSLRPLAFDLIGGSSSSINERLAGAGTRNSPAQDILGLNEQIAINRSAKGMGTPGEEAELDRQHTEFIQKKIQLTAELATVTSAQLRITQEEANIAKGRLQTSQIAFSLQDRGTQNRVMHLGRQMNEAMGLQGAAREAAMARFTPEQLQMLQGVGTERTTRFVQEVGRFRAKQMGFDPVFSDGELSAIKSAGIEGKRIEDGARAALKASGVGNVAGDLTDVLMRELRAHELQVFEASKKNMEEFIRQLTKEIIQKYQEESKSQEKTAQLRRANNQFAV